MCNGVLLLCRYIFHSNEVIQALRALRRLCWLRQWAPTAQLRQWPLASALLRLLGALLRSLSGAQPKTGPLRPPSEPSGGGPSAAPEGALLVRPSGLRRPDGRLKGAEGPEPTGVRRPEGAPSPFRGPEAKGGACTARRGAYRRQENNQKAKLSTRHFGR